MEKQGKTGVLVVDMQETWLKNIPDRDYFCDNVSDFLNSLKGAAFCGYAEFHAKSTNHGKTSEILTGVNISSDSIFEKSCMDVFSNVALEKRLHDSGVSEIVVAGVCAAQCVLKSVYGAVGKGFGVVTSPDLVRRTYGPSNYLELYCDVGVNVLSSRKDVLDYVVSRNR